MDIQLDFLKEANKWLEVPSNQKKYAITESDTNPSSDKLCVYILGGWAVQQHYEYRDTNDIDIIGYLHQVRNLLIDMDNENKFKPISAPDSTKTYTRKTTLQNQNHQHFSLEARFFDENNQISFGKIKLNSKWLHEDSKNFDQHVTGELAQVKVPSKVKVVTLKMFSIIGRPEREEDKILNDFVDIHNMTKDDKDKSYSKIIFELKALDFVEEIDNYSQRLMKVEKKLIERIPNIKNSFLYYVLGLQKEKDEILKNRTSIIEISQNEMLLTRNNLIKEEFNLSWGQISKYIREELTIIGWSCNNVFSNRNNIYFEQMLNNGIKINIIILSPKSMENDNPNKINFGPICNHSNDPKWISTDINQGIDSFNIFHSRLKSEAKDKLKLYFTNYLITWSCVAIDKNLDSGRIQIEMYHYDNPDGNHLDDRLNIILSSKSNFYSGFCNSIENIMNASIPQSVH